jgi:hypothetical protein
MGEDIVFAAITPRLEALEAMAVFAVANFGPLLFTEPPFGRSIATNQERRASAA